MERFDALQSRFNETFNAHGPAILAAVSSRGSSAPPDPAAFTAFVGTVRTLAPQMRMIAEEEILKGLTKAIAPAVTLAMFGRGCSTTSVRARQLNARPASSRAPPLRVAGQSL